VRRASQNVQLWSRAKRHPRRTSIEVREALDLVRHAGAPARERRDPTPIRSTRASSTCFASALGLAQGGLAGSQRAAPRDTRRPMAPVAHQSRRKRGRAAWRCALADQQDVVEQELVTGWFGVMLAELRGSGRLAISINRREASSTLRVDADSSPADQAAGRWALGWTTRQAHSAVSLLTSPGDAGSSPDGRDSVVGCVAGRTDGRTSSDSVGRQTLRAISFIRQTQSPPGRPGGDSILHDVSG
jgi:hypothetical protein